jgi:hypothetical protein
MQAWINFQLKLGMKLKKKKHLDIHRVSDIHIIRFNNIYYSLDKVIV